MRHSREILCFFTKNKAIYSIPVYFPVEEKMFGSILEIQFEMDKIKGLYIVSKDGQSVGCCDDKIGYYKTTVMPLETKPHLS